MGEKELRLESQSRWAWLGGILPFFLLFIVLWLVGMGSLPALADEGAASYPETGKWFVPSPVAGTISEALALAKPGDEIIVDSTYDSRIARAVGTAALIPQGSPELFPLRIEKSQIKISCQALPGWDGGWNRPRIFAPPAHAAIVIAADGVRVEGCEIDSGGVGIVVTKASNVRISGNLFSGLHEGIRLIEASKSVIQDNLLTGVEGLGLHLESSGENLLQDNRVEKGGAGLFLLSSRDNKVEGDVYQGNDSAGLHLEDSRENSLDGLTVTGNGGEGMLLVSSNSNKITTNEISNNHGGGIVLVGSDNNEIMANLLEDNGAGPILASAGELVLFTTPILTQTGPMKVEDPYAAARQGKAELQAKVRELDDQIADLGRELLGMMKDIEPGPAQTSSARLSMNLGDALSKTTSIREAVIPLIIGPLLKGIEGEADTLKGEELGPNKDEILEELKALLQLLSEVDDQLAQLKLILDDGEREGDMEEFDDVVDWLEEALSALGVNGEHLGEALEGARRKLEVALVQSGRADGDIEEMLECLMAIDEKLAPPPIPDFILEGTRVIGEVIAPSISDERITQFKRELVDRLNGDEGVLLKAERLGLLPIDMGDLKIERRSLPTPSGNSISSNFGQGTEAIAPWKGKHFHLFSGMVKTGCLDRRSPSPGMGGACSSPTEVVIAAEVGGENDAGISDGLKGQGIEGRGATLSKALVYPNPVKGEALLFLAEGQGIAQISVEIFNLAGSEVCNSGWQVGRTFEWPLQNRWGEIVANGVYLYVVMVRGLDGRVIRSKVGKLAVLR